MQQLELENRRLTERAEEKEKTASEARADCDEARGALFQVEFLVFFSLQNDIEMGNFFNLLTAENR